MIYVSLDIETTGLETDRYDVLSIGAIIEDTNRKLPFEEIPKFHAAIKRQEIVGSPFAINMNRDLISDISEYMDARTEEKRQKIEKRTGMEFLFEDEVVENFYYFLYVNGVFQSDEGGIDLDRPSKLWKGKMVPLITSKTIKPAYITVAGKNFGTFDKKFLERLPRWKQLIRTRSRLLDPSILYIDWENDVDPPSLNTCKERAGISGEVSHNALEDAWDVIQVLRKKY